MIPPTDLRSEASADSSNDNFIQLPPKPSIQRQFPKQPFTNIAIAASGGGFRAASFLLGTLSYLQHVRFQGEPLLKQVTYIASASGGSLASAFYRRSLLKGQSFSEYFKTIHNFLNGTETLKDVATLLADDTKWPAGGKRRNLINAFARVYDQKLEGMTLGDIYGEDPAIPIREMCFNTTEFYRGLWFRFQTQQSGTPNTIGNKFLKFKPEGLDTAKKVKIGDIIAASSCFPAGFEPMRFPDDFSHDTLTRQELRTAIEFPDRLPEEQQIFGLMDGGIVDNQAIASMVEADRRRSKRLDAGFNLAIITDVSNKYISPFVPRQLTTEGSDWQAKSLADYWRSVQNKLSWGIYAGILGLLLFAVSLSTLIFAPKDWMRITGALFVLPTLAASLLGFYVNKVARKSKEWLDQLRKTIVKKVSILSDDTIWPVSTFFTNLPLGTLIGMLTDRLGSIVILASDLFLKRIRRADYNRLYEDPVWQFRLASNFIYDLSTENKSIPKEKNRKSDKPDKAQWCKELTPSTKLSDVAERARLMDTTLWFDEAHRERLGDVTATGQFTTCYNLMQYICRLQKETKAYDRLSDDVKQAVDDLRTHLLADWNRFQNDPFWLYNQYNQNNR
ncbi:hypothetical protein GCM10027592_55360 [Spirosoma flavus]